MNKFVTLYHYIVNKYSIKKLLIILNLLNSKMTKSLLRNLLKIDNKFGKNIFVYIYKDD